MTCRPGYGNCDPNPPSPPPPRHVRHTIGTGLVAAVQNMVITNGDDVFQTPSHHVGTSLCSTDNLLVLQVLVPTHPIHTRHHLVVRRLLHSTTRNTLVQWQS